MAKATVATTVFNSGQISPLLFERKDAPFYQGAFRYGRNFLATVQGSIIKRPGTRFVYPAKNTLVQAGNAIRLIPFVFNSEQGYALEFGAGYVRFFLRGSNNELGVLVDGNGDIVEVATPYSADDLPRIQYAQQADQLWLVHPSHPIQVLSRKSAIDWEIAEYETVGGPLLNRNIDEDVTFLSVSLTLGNTVATPKLYALSEVQKGSTVEFAFNHDGNSKNPSLLPQVGQTLSIRVQVSGFQPWQPDSQNRTPQKKYRVGRTAYYARNVYLNVSDPNAVYSDVNPPVHTKDVASDGKIDWKYLHSGEGSIRVTDTGTLANGGIYVIGTVETANLPLKETKPEDGIAETADNWGDAKGEIITTDWALGAMSPSTGYPSTVSFFQQRLWLSGIRQQPQTVWASHIDKYNTFTLGSNDDEGVQFTIASDQVDLIQWLVPTRMLIAGTPSSEFSIRANQSNAAITPSNINVAPETAYGCEPDVQPLRAGSSVFYVERGGKKLRESRFNYDIDGLVADDRTIYAEDIFIADDGEYGRMTALALQRTPIPILWTSLSNGILAGMSYERGQEVHGWHLHDLGGKVVGMCVIPDRYHKEDRMGSG